MRRGHIFLPSLSFLSFAMPFHRNECCLVLEKVCMPHLSAQFHCRFSCASWETCCSSGLSSCHRPFCHRFLSGRFLGPPTTTCLLKDATHMSRLNTVPLEPDQNSGRTLNLPKMTFFFWKPTHDGQSGSLGQLALHTLEHFQPRAVQLTAVDGAVS